MPVWLQLLFLLGFPIMFFVTLAAWIIDHIWFTPKESKALKKAARKKKPIIPVAFDNGQIELKVCKEIGDEGYIKTDDGWIGFLARPIAQGNPGNKNVEKVNPLVTRVFMLKDAKIPFLVGYAGKAVLTNPQALAIMEHAQKTKQKIKLPFEVKAKKMLADVFWPVNLRTIKSVFQKQWNQAQIRAMEKKSELTGMKKGEKYYGKEGLKFFVLPGMIIIAIIILAIIFLVLGK